MTDRRLLKPSDLNTAQNLLLQLSEVNRRVNRVDISLNKMSAEIVVFTATNDREVSAKFNKLNDPLRAELGAVMKKIILRDRESLTDKLLALGVDAPLDYIAND